METLQAAKRQEAERDMGAYTERCRVIDRVDFRVVLVSPEAGVDLPELMIAGNRIFAGQFLRALAIVDENNMQSVPFRRLPDPGFVNLYLTRIWESQKAGESVPAVWRKMQRTARSRHQPAGIEALILSPRKVT